MTRPVNTKIDLDRRFIAGECGNRGPVWFTIEEWVKDGEQEPCMIRSRVPDGTNRTMVPAERVRYEFMMAEIRGHLPTINLQCPEHDKILTGEVCLSHRGIDFSGSQDAFVDQRM